MNKKHEITMKSTTEREIKTVRRQLSRTDAWLEGVSCHCRFGCPIVVYHPPYHQERVHPTLFWLACPWLKHLVDRLESTSIVKKLEKQLQEDAKLAATFRQQQNDFNEYLKNKVETLEMPIGTKNRLMSLSISGTSEPMTVKCLHSHLAVRLAGFPTMMGDHVLNWLKENYKDETLCIFKEVMQS